MVDDYKPSWKRAYPAPFTKETAFKVKFDTMIEKGTIERVTTLSAWAESAFIIQKKNQIVRFINDFRDLDKMLKRKKHQVDPKVDLNSKKGQNLKSSLHPHGNSF